MPALQDFIKKNASESLKGNVGKGFIAFDIANLVTGEHKMKSILQIFKDLLLLRPVLATGFAGLFLAMGKSVRSLVRDTGSLDAMLRKLTQIQGLQRMFAPLVGGAAAAKLKVAELVNFAASRKISLGDAGSAARSLQLMTRGGFSSASALDTVLDAAKGTGTGFTEMADAVGELNAQLRDGGSITSSVEQLRQMGAVSDTTAESLVALQQNGASAGQIFTAFTASLEQFKGSAKDAAGDIIEINAAYETASANLQEKLASPFVASDIQNTKNMTDAMNGIAPAVSRISGVMAILFNGFSTVKSAMAKMAGESVVVKAVLEGLVYVFTGLVTAASLAGAVMLGTWLIAGGGAAAIGGLTAVLVGATAATGILTSGLIAMGVSAATAATIMAGLATAITAVGVAARVALIASGIGIFIAIAATAAGVALQLSAAVERTAKAMQELAESQNQANSAIVKQIKDVRTLAERHDVLAKSMAAVTAAQLALNEANKKGNQAEIDNAESNLAMVQKTARQAARIRTDSLAPSAESAQADRDKVKRELEQKEEKFQTEMAISTPKRQAQLLEQRAAESEKKAKAATASEAARIKFARDADSASLNMAQKESDVRDAQIQVARHADIERSSKNVFGIDTRTDEEKSAQQQSERALHQAILFQKLAAARQDKIGLNAPKGTSVQLEAEQRRMLAGNDPDKARKSAEIGLQAERARQVEAMRAEHELIALRDREAAKAIERETKLSRMALQHELDLQAAQIKGDSKTQQDIEDFSVFADKFQELLSQGFSNAEAEKGAKQFADNAITLDARNSALQAASGTVADSLTRIGGGGGVFAPSGDPMLTAAQRQLAVQEDSRDYLRVLADGAGKKGVL